MRPVIGLLIVQMDTFVKARFSTLHIQHYDRRHDRNEKHQPDEHHRTVNDSLIAQVTASHAGHVFMCVLWLRNRIQCRQGLAVPIRIREALITASFVIQAPAGLSAWREE
jgi:hypothetical protein